MDVDSAKTRFAGISGEKLCLTVNEAAAYSGIGINRIRSLLNEPDCPFVMRVGRKKMVKKAAFEEFIKNADQI